MAEHTTAAERGFLITTGVARHMSNSPPQPHPLTSVMQLSVTAAALLVAASAVTFAVLTALQKRNADLVGIGVSVLRADPTDQNQVGAAREWALNLIDANAGGVKFSQEARAALLRQRLPYGSTYIAPYSSTYTPPELMGRFIEPSSGRIFDRPGFDPLTGNRLKPLSPENSN